MKPLLQANSLCRETAEGQPLLEGISLTIQPRDRIAVQGPAGSGKTLLLRALALLDPTSAGNLLWRQEPVPNGDVPSFRSQVAYLPQTPALADGTVETNLRLPFSLGIYDNRAYDESRVVGLLGRLGKDADFLTRPVVALSGGERQIVALVRLVQLEPTILLLDEPTAALDPATTTAAQNLIEEWMAAESSRAFVWVSHDDQQAQAVSRQRIRMSEGRIE